MSAIDQYNYTCLGVVECPVPYRFFAGQESIGAVYVAIYQLEQDIPTDETDFQGNSGDILVGGGGGEAPAMRIRVPEAFVLYTDSDHYFDEYPESDDPVYSIYWSPNATFMLCAGYEKLGWNPETENIGNWLTQHVLSFLVREYADVYAHWLGPEPLELDGSICRKLTGEEDKICNWKKYKYGTQQ